MTKLNYIRTYGDPECRSESETGRETEVYLTFSAEEELGSPSALRGGAQGAPAGREHGQESVCLSRGQLTGHFWC